MLFPPLMMDAYSANTWRRPTSRKSSSTWIKYSKTIGRPLEEFGFHLSYVPSPAVFGHFDKWFRLELQTEEKRDGLGIREPGEGLRLLQQKYLQSKGHEAHPSKGIPLLMALTWPLQWYVETSDRIDTQFSKGVEAMQIRFAASTGGRYQQVYQRFNSKDNRRRLFGGAQWRNDGSWRGWSADWGYSKSPLNPILLRTSLI